MTDGLEVRVVECYRRAVVVACGEVDMSTVPILHDALVAAQKIAADVVIDLGGGTFIDSTGINALIGAYRRRPEDGSLKVFGATSIVRRVLEITGVAELLVLKTQPLAWQQVTYHSSGWRQWMTEKRTNDGVPLAEIIEIGAPGGGSDDGVRYALEHQGETSLFGSLEEAMRAAALLCSDH